MVSRVGQAPRLAAMTARSGQSFIVASSTACHLSRLETSVTVVAIARKLACLIYPMVACGQPYLEQGPALSMYPRAICLLLCQP